MFIKLKLEEEVISIDGGSVDADDDGGGGGRSSHEISKTSSSLACFGHNL